MGQIKLLKISSEGIPLEMDTSNDEVTMKSFTVTSGPILDAAGLDMNSLSIKTLANVTFDNPAANTVNGIIANDLMGQAKENTMAIGAAVLFPQITDAADSLDAFRLPSIAGAPSATPADGGEGYLVYDRTNNKPYLWTGAMWDDLTSMLSAERLDEQGFNADGSLAARDVVYISAADKVKKAKADAEATSRAIGFSVEAEADTDPAIVRTAGIIDGFSSLTPGARQYLSAATAGAITETLPVGTGNVITQVGYAKSTTAVQIQIQQLGRRA